MKVLSIFISLLLLTGYYTIPKKEIQFSKISNIKELQGGYSNKGDPTGYLSQKILQYGYSSIKLNDGNFIKHEKIKLIKVIVKNNIVTVQAIQNECIVYDKEYVYNQDFKLDNGVIVKKREFALLSRGLGDV
jgi:hypothetical protein